MEPGFQLGQYKIESLLGQGGMGVVYRALDTRLNRPVAIKVLSNDLADVAARRRFQREAQMASALNHPHILTVYDAGEFEGRQYLVMEFVDGTTLKGWARADKRTWRQIAELLTGVADGLADAHAAGILHRDVKPENVLVAKNGYAKLADFGLAKLFDRGSQEETTRTATLEATQPGMAVGTIAYMSPEQASGRPVDARSDIFAFGVLLHEVLAGQRPFRGVSDLEVLQAILHGEPARLSVEVPAALRSVSEKALEKDPADRYQTMRDLVVDLRRFSRQTAETPIAAAAHAGPRHRRWTVTLGIAALALALGFGAGRSFWPKPRPAATNVQFQRITDFIGIEESPAISPDGKTVAFVAQAGGQRQIWIRLLSGGVPLQITRDNADHQEPRWASDSGSLIYFSPASDAAGEGTIWEVSALGGAPHPIVTAVTAGDISHDGRRIAIFRTRGKDVDLVQINRDGSNPRVVAGLHGNYDRPRWSPDDRWIAFHHGLEDVFNDTIDVVSAAGGTPHEVAHADSMRGLAWLPDSSGLIYSSSTGSTILYPPVFNLRMVRRDGGGERQLTFGDASYGEPDAAAGGRLAASRLRIQSDVWNFPVTGSPADNTRNAIRITRQTGQAQTPSASPDGKEVVFLSDSGGHGNLWVAKADGSAVRQITFEHDPAVVLGVPIWSPTQNQIVFILTRNGNTGEWVVNPDGSGLHQLVEHGSGAMWSADGRWLYYAKGACIEKVPVSGGSARRVRCETLPLPSGITRDGSTLYYANPDLAFAVWDIQRAQPESGPSQPLTRVPGQRIPVDRTLWQSVLSPDDQWLAAPLADQGSTNVWVMPAAGGLWRKVTDFGERSVVIMRRISWAPDSKSIYAAIADVDADIVLFDGLLP